MTRLVRILVVVVLIVGAFGATVPSVAAGDCGTHVVQRGETLFRIALRYHVNMYALASANGIPNINRIYAGQRLIIPCDGDATPPTYNPPVSNSPYYRPPASNSNYYNHPTYIPKPYTSDYEYGLSCSGFRATSPGSFPNGNITFYWDTPSSASAVARYQVHIFNAVGREVRSYEATAPTYNLTGDVGLGALGGGINFSYVVIAVGKDGKVCRSQSVRVQREWTGTSDPTS